MEERLSRNKGPVDRAASASAPCRLDASFVQPEPLLASSLTFMSEPSSSSPIRGFFIVLEGLDRSGKSTQAQLLLDHFASAGYPVQSWKFPGERCNPFPSGRVKPLTYE